MEAKKLLLILGIVTMLLLTGCGSGRYDELAQCMTKSGAKMYGAYWCPHCKEQKQEFGKSWEYVNYIECSLPGGKQQTQLCQDAEIKGYPTWEFGDGSRKEGKISPEQLGQLTGCPVG